MTKPELTKMLMAQTLKKLMKSTHLDKISVQNIVDACGLNRKTFYYHFQDKQALICWIFDSEFAGLTDLNNDNTIIDELVEHLYLNKDFYMAAITSDVQNNLREHFFKIVHDSIMKKILNLLGENKMPSKDMDMIANYFSNAAVGTITQWAREGMRTSPYEYSSKFYPLIEECLDFVVHKYIEE